MPFTISHAAAAAPLRRLAGDRLVLSAAIAGTMAPDFEYLFHLSARRTISHTLAGQFLMCLPLALLALVVWHRLVAPAWMPLVTGRPAAPFRFLPLGRFAAVAASVLAGSFSHLAWDAFTHEHGFVVVRVAFLAAETGPGGLRGYAALQYASSLVGAAVLAAWAHRHSRFQFRFPLSTAAPPAALALVAALGGAGANTLRALAGGAAVRQSVAAASIGAMAAGVLALVAVSAYLVVSRGAPLRP